MTVYKIMNMKMFEDYWKYTFKLYNMWKIISTIFNRVDGSVSADSLLEMM